MVKVIGKIFKFKGICITTPYRCATAKITAPKYQSVGCHLTHGQCSGMIHNVNVPDKCHYCAEHKPSQRAEPWITTPLLSRPGGDNCFGSNATWARPYLAEGLTSIIDCIHCLTYILLLRCSENCITTMHKVHSTQKRFHLIYVRVYCTSAGKTTYVRQM